MKGGLWIVCYIWHLGMGMGVMLKIERLLLLLVLPGCDTGETHIIIPDDSDQ